MDIPAPSSVGDETSFGLMPVDPELMRLSNPTPYAVPVWMHELGGEKERAETGPRELLERTRGMLAKAGMAMPWGAGARIHTPEDAAQFATAGYTWFKIEAARTINHRAETMSLEELDGAIVRLEDEGALQPGWHEAYVGREFPMAPPPLSMEDTAKPLRYPDEALARMAVKFGPVLALAAEVSQVIRGNWIGREGLPDIEVSLAPAGPVMTREEWFFVVQELKTRLDRLVAVAPPLGNLWEPGADVNLEHAEAYDLFKVLGHMTREVRLSIPGMGVPTVQYHWDHAESERLGFLSRLAEKEPAYFREWLEAARLAFPLARAGWPISLTEEEARFLPQVEDAELQATFLETLAGRQLLLATWDAVRGTEIGARMWGLVEKMG